jgi:hypothetical protein
MATAFCSYQERIREREGQPQLNQHRCRLKGLVKHPSHGFYHTLRERCRQNPLLFVRTDYKTYTHLLKFFNITIGDGIKTFLDLGQKVNF